MKFKLKLVVLSILLGLLLICSTQSVAQEGRSYIPKHIHPCLEAKDRMGDEWYLAELMSVSETGEADCEIVIMFTSEKGIEKFEELRRRKGLDPDFVDYKDRRIKIRKTIGKMVPH